jgi:hypothetical protein
MICTQGVSLIQCNQTRFLQLHCGTLWLPSGETTRSSDNNVEYTAVAHAWLPMCMLHCNCFPEPTLRMQVEEAARLCQSHDIPHVINNAYGVQSSWICSQITRACRVGRVDVVIQSTDKNFMVPVGGAVAAVAKGREGGLLQDMAGRYPGRAGVSAHLDVFITLLHLGQQGWLKVLQEREELQGPSLLCVGAACSLSWHLQTSQQMKWCSHKAADFLTNAAN